MYFFRKGIPNYVDIDLKRSPSNLNLGQCKFITGQCQRRQNCIELYIIRFVLLGQGRLYYFMVTHDQKAITTSETNAADEKMFVIYSEKLMTSFLIRIFF